MKKDCLPKFNRFKFKNRYEKPIFNSLYYSILRRIARNRFKNLILKNKSAKLLVHLHLFYPESLNTILEYLKNLEDYNYDLIVTCTEGHYNHKVLEKLKQFKQNVKIYVYPNYGFDVAPFVEVLHKVDLSNYDIIFKLHSKGVKKSFRYVYNQIFKYEDWFFNLFNGVLGAFNVHNVIDKLYNSKNIGLVASKNLIINDPKHKQYFTSKVAEQYGVKIKDNYQYVAGTCFAVKACTMGKIKSLGLHLNDFSYVERGKFSLAHAMERLICANVEAQGYDFYGIPVKHRQYKYLKKKYEKYSSLKLLDDPRFNIDYEYFYRSLELYSIKKYEIVNIKLKDLKRYWDDEYLSLDQCHPYKYLQGNKEQYLEYCVDNKRKFLIDMNEERFNSLLNSIESSNFDEKFMPIINRKNVIRDGQHRCCILYHKYGGDYEVKCLRLSFHNSVGLSLFEKIFSITNSNDKRHKIITILGFRLSIKRGKK